MNEHFTEEAGSIARVCVGYAKGDGVFQKLYAYLPLPQPSLEFTIAREKERLLAELQNITLEP